MIIVNQERPSMNELLHFGIKGMKWGIRRKKDPKQELTSDEKRARIRRNAKIAVGAVVAARVLFVVGTMAAGTVLNNRAVMDTGVRALERSNIINSTLSRGVFKVTTL